MLNHFILYIEMLDLARHVYTTSKYIPNLFPSHCNLDRPQISFDDSLPIAFVTQRIIQYGEEKDRKNAQSTEEKRSFYAGILLMTNRRAHNPRLRLTLSRERKRSFYAGKTLILCRNTADEKSSCAQSATKVDPQ